MFEHLFEHQHVIPSLPTSHRSVGDLCSSGVEDCITKCGVRTTSAWHSRLGSMCSLCDRAGPRHDTVSSCLVGCWRGPGAHPRNVQCQLPAPSNCSAHRTVGPVLVVLHQTAGAVFVHVLFLFRVISRLDCLLRIPPRTLSCRTTMAQHATAVPAWYMHESVATTPPAMQRWHARARSGCGLAVVYGKAGASELCNCTCSATPETLKHVYLTARTRTTLAGAFRSCAMLMHGAQWCFSTAWSALRGHGASPCVCTARHINSPGDGSVRSLAFGHGGTRRS
jgi:hypothetical protein